MKKIRSGVTGFVAAVVGGVAAAVALICAGCNDGGIADGDGTAGRFINRFYGVEVGGNTWMWMRKNLNVETEDSWCYDNNPKNCETYGRLYTWEAAKSACQRIGWRLPSRNEWWALIEAAGDRDLAGKRLKAKNGWQTSDWEYLGKGGNGTDKYGFSALPGGYRNSDGSFDSTGYLGVWWTADDFYYMDDDYYVGKAIGYQMNNQYDYAWQYDGLKSNGLSVRCVMDL
jgi:uncharacterized protein (TIGR02145 family)